MTTDAYWDPELETLPWSAVEAWQAPRVADALVRIGAASTFYRDRLDRAVADRVRSMGLAALAEIPATTKDELRIGQASASDLPLGILQAVPTDRLVQIVSSSGTTGTPLYYGLTRADIDTWADACAATFFTAGVRPGDVVGHLVGLPMVAGGLSYADGYRRLGAALAWVGGFSSERVLRSLMTLRATALLATTSFGVYLAESCEELIGMPASALGIRKLQLGGEPGLANPQLRATVEVGWGTTHVREGMGLADVLAAMWSECDAQMGMHFNAQKSVAIELVEPNTRERIEWSDGALGEILYTTFEREATPVVRYASADRVRVIAMDCACGRTSPRMVVVGRTDDMLIYKGMNVFPTAIRDTILNAFPTSFAPHVRIWKDRADQVQFDRPIEVEIEQAPGGGDIDRAGLEAQIGRVVRDHLQVRVSVAIVPAGSLPRSTHKTGLVATRDGG